MSSAKSVHITKSAHSNSRIRRMHSRRKRKSDTPQQHTLLQLQQHFGNQAVGRMIQAKLTIGESNDKYEREADQVADKVMRMPESARLEDEETTVQKKTLVNQISPLVQRAPQEAQSGEEEPLVQAMPEEAAEKEEEEQMFTDKPLIQRKPQTGVGVEEETVQTKPLIQRQAEEDEPAQANAMFQRQEIETEEEKLVHAKGLTATNTWISPSVASDIQSLQGKGQKLPEVTKNFFGPRFGSDFSQVRVHTDARAAHLARSINARAFTLGRDVVFGAGEYSTDTFAGKKLLAHELTHVVQQKNMSTVGNRIVSHQIAKTCSPTVQRYDILQQMLDYVALRDDVEDRLKVAGPVDAGELVRLIKGAKPAVRRRLYLNDKTRTMVMTRLGGAESESVFSAMLSGILYYPGWESDSFRAMGAAERDEVIQKTDDLFIIETGISRKLTMDLEDKPLVRRWLELRDAVISDASKKVVRQAEQDAAYNEYLREAVEKLKGVSFGSATEVGGGSYDLANWESEEDSKYAGRGKLVLKPGVEPSIGVRELFDDLSNWAFDCAEFVQVSHLYARWKTMGDDTFNRFSGGKLEIRMHYSTGVYRALGYQRSAAGDKMTRIEPGGKFIDATPVDELLDEAPIGSRITWRNILANPSSDFYNENTLKLGDDQYGAHGFSGSSNVFSRAELEKELSATTYSGPDPEPPQSYIEANVFIRSIEHYQKPKVQE
jgi:Domain of unknown function (DUF4157)/Protein-glutamine gamma-glutamyltransferase